MDVKLVTLVVATCFVAFRGQLCRGQSTMPPTICSSQPSTCKCVFANGSTIDLMDAASDVPDEPEFYRVLGTDNFYYYYNPCFAFSIGGDGCAGVAACQEWYQQFHAIGYQQNEKIIWGQDAKGTYIYYQGAFDNFAINGRFTKVYLECTEDKKDAVLSVEGDKTEQHLYVMKLTHRSACLNKASSSAGISIGTYMCIAFLVILVLYLTIGMAFMRFRRGAEGKEMIPNYSLWADLPGLMKDGVDFLREKVTGFSSKSKVEYEQI